MPGVAGPGVTLSGPAAGASSPFDVGILDRLQQFFSGGGGGGMPSLQQQQMKQAAMKDLSQLGQGLLLASSRQFQPLGWRGPNMAPGGLNAAALQFVQPGMPVPFGGLRIL